MAFTSVIFLVFMGILVILYYMIPKRFQWILLLAGSYAFYLCGGVKTVIYLLLTTFSTYLAGIGLGSLNFKSKNLAPEDKKTGKAKIKKSKQRIVLAAALFNFGMLYMLKYWAFTAEVIKSSTGFALYVPNLLMPLGVSFYIFQSVGYVVDMYRGKYEAQRNFAKYALFVSFFPQIIQGPISRYNQLAPQLLGGHSLNWDQIKYGIQLAMWGYFKKLVIAERAGVLVNEVYGNTGVYSGSMMAAATLGYCIQLYCDFSGGIDITRGAAQMLDIDMIQNFKRPIFARSLADYWRRWHISLGQWMRDYLFYPLALSKGFTKMGGFARKHFRGTLGRIFATSLATFCIYFVIGIWHGANFRYITYGFYNGAIITASLLLEPTFARIRKKLPINWKGAGWHFVQMARTCIIVFIGRYITRAPRLLTAFYMIKMSVMDFRLSSFTDGTLFDFGLSGFDYIVIGLGMAVVLAVETYQERGGEVRKSLEQKNPFVQWLAVIIPLLVIILLGAVDQGYVAAEFIYAQF